MNILKFLLKRQPCTFLGIVDANPDIELPRKFSEKFVLLNEDNKANLKLYVLNDKNNKNKYLIEIYPTLGKWLARCFDEAKIEIRPPNNHPLEKYLHSINISNKKEIATKVIELVTKKKNYSIMTLKDWLTTIFQ